MDNRAVPSSQVLTADCDGHEIVTIEGLSDPITNEMDPLQQKFIDKYAFQCEMTGADAEGMACGGVIDVMMERL